MANQEAFNAAKAKLDKQHNMGLISKGEHIRETIGLAAQHGVDSGLTSKDVEYANKEAADTNAAFSAAKQAHGENFMMTQEGRDFLFRNYHDRRGEK